MSDDKQLDHKPVPRGLRVARELIDAMQTEFKTRNQQLDSHFIRLAEAVSVVASECSELLATGRNEEARVTLERMIAIIESVADPVRRARP